MTRILVAEDDRLVSSFVSKGLRESGYGVEAAADGETALELCRTGDFDLLILDIGLPVLDGFGVLRRLRAAGLILPVIVLTGRPDRDVVEALEAGADDFMPKPFRFAELLARIHARLRSSSSASPIVLRVGDVELDIHTHRARVRGRAVDLTSREFALLETLMRHPDHVLSREQLLSHVWGYDFDPATNLVNVYVSSLRRKLGDGYIETVRGSGYRLCWSGAPLAS
ncbi:response regulator transcription factor [Microbacterium sp. 2FI]|uniref:response regulator transcription factor n=1 Tax=Microbacterium sp. 2FI TaxID=2502193 RepID=UPI0010F7B894|nr:response regulator transcription factor [Microbacterium sp. 2FI]